VAISFFNSGLVLWTLQQVSVAAGNPVDLAGFSALFPLIAVVTMLPISLGGLGIREWAYVEGLALLKVPADRHDYRASHVGAHGRRRSRGDLSCLCCVESRAKM
jgi:hypothetical protein